MSPKPWCLSRCWLSFVFMVGNAIAQSAQPIISYNFGLGLAVRVRSTECVALATAIVCGLTVTVAFTFVPDLLVSLFVNPQSPAARIAIDGFPYFSAGFVFFVVNIAAVGYFQSVERVVPATVFSLLRGAVFLIPCFIMLPSLVGIPGVWLALSLSEFATSVVIGLFVVCKGRYCGKV